jgi:hypothetical protein
LLQAVSRTIVESKNKNGRIFFMLNYLLINPGDALWSPGFFF